MHNWWLEMFPSRVSMLLLDQDPKYEDFLTAEDFKLLVETLVDCGLLCFDGFDAESTIEDTLLTDIKYTRLVKKMQRIIL
jgi:hypothetical protein